MCRPAVRTEPDPRGVRFVVGRSTLGKWTVLDRDGRVGGTFIDRLSAMHFAMEESDFRAGAVCCMPDAVTIGTDPVFDERPAVPIGQAVDKGNIYFR